MKLGLPNHQPTIPQNSNLIQLTMRLMTKPRPKWIRSRFLGYSQPSMSKIKQADRIFSIAPTQIIKIPIYISIHAVGIQKLVKTKMHE